MLPRMKFGLISGAIGLVLNVCVAAVLGICGPMLAIIAGALAGYFAAKGEKLPTQGEGAKAGAIAGAIAGGLTLIGQILGGIGVLTIFPAIMDIPMAGLTGQLSYWLSGLMTATCFGLIGVGLAAGAGAGTGYLGTPSQSVNPPTPQ
ncbi:MAG: hypothetical protein QMD04_05150 [Anaerolineales bacterium]|nr:hypothetical protein [Anaerolineales bacterium]